VKVPHSEDLASHAVPESCVVYREVQREALTGVQTGQPLSRERFKVQGADAVSVVEGNTMQCDIASAALALRGLRPLARLYTPCTGTGRSPAWPSLEH
jgi:hypothetical protein